MLVDPFAACFRFLCYAKVAGFSLLFLFFFGRVFYF